MDQENWQVKLYRNIALKNHEIVADFKFLYGIILGILLIGGYLIFTHNPIYPTFMELGTKLGRLALVLLGVIVLPGILGRFSIDIPISRTITLFRRQLGITSFLLVFTHYNLVRNLPRLAGILPFKLPFPLFETVGFTAMMFLFFLFLTSNDWSQKKLGKWWKRLHMLVYVILWLIVAHTALQRISIWTYLIGIFAVLEVSSLLWAKFSTKSA